VETQKPQTKKDNKKKQAKRKESGKGFPQPCQSVNHWNSSPENDILTRFG
jgi:hypothetical protein